MHFLSRMHYSSNESIDVRSYFRYACQILRSPTCELYVCHPPYVATNASKFSRNIHELSVNTAEL